MLKKIGIGVVVLFVVFAVIGALGRGGKNGSGGGAEAPQAAAPATATAPAVQAEKTATPAPEPTATPAPVVLSGSGQSVAGPVPLKSGLIRVKMHYGGARNFAVKLLEDGTGKPAGGTAGLDSLLANQIGAWDGEKAVRIDKAGAYVLDVTASGPWEITITQ